MKVSLQKSVGSQMYMEQKQKETKILSCWAENRDTENLSLSSFYWHGTIQNLGLTYMDLKFQFLATSSRKYCRLKYSTRYL